MKSKASFLRKRHFRASVPTSLGQFLKRQKRLGYAEHNFRVTLLWLFTLWNVPSLGRFLYVRCLAIQEVLHSDLIFVLWPCSMDALSSIFALTVNSVKRLHTARLFSASTCLDCLLVREGSVFVSVVWLCFMAEP